MTRDADQQDWLGWNVAITGMNARPDNPGPGCAVARCLRHTPGFRGHIVGLGYGTLETGLYLRESCDSGHLLPYPATGSTALLERLDEVLCRDRIDALLPCLDADLANFMAIEDQLGQRGIRLLLPQRGQLRRRDKDRLPALCAEAGVATPDVRRLADERFFDHCEADGWTYPLVIKSVFYDAWIVHSAAEARQRYRQIVATWGNPVLIQKFVLGDEVNLTALGDGSGAMIGEVMIRKQATTDKGKAWAGVAIDDPELQEAGRRLFHSLKWRGPLEVEMLRDAGGTLQLIEINPRFPAWIYLSHGVGRNLPAALLALMNGARPGDLDLASPRPGTSFLRHAQETIVSLDEIATLTASGSTLRPCPPVSLAA
ncbi:ATP-grasp domain-containing protein [Ottowia sp.]|uniref:ATP-grasp domain-containing protein n=1 Tax=Ottowia sp. TaxID=1898956 RepID=UPI002614E365|nr:ATP-grasp domain-containing protein [Ottowia sp.]